MLIGHVGSGLIWLAILTFFASVVLWAIRPRYAAGERLAKISFTVGCFALFGAFAALAALFMTDQFQYEYVFGRSDRINPWYYKFASVWAGQEGSFLLWAVCSALFALVAMKSTGLYRRWYTIANAFFLGSLAAILAYESPFRVPLFDGQPIMPPNGVGMTPALQNVWVVIHPPAIFLGFGSLAILAAFGFAAMIVGNTTDWIARVRPWAILSMSLTGFGLCLGGIWAYETLGWGGFWAWDPVENTSFVPWLLGVMFVHGLLVQASTKKWQVSNLLMAGLPFLAFCYGTFLTRSGVLAETSVHSFAEMNRIALIFLVGFVSLAYAIYLGTWFWRWNKIRKEPKPESSFKPEFFLNREGLYKSGMVLLLLTALTTAIGMSYPFFTGLAGQAPKIIEEHTYNMIVAYFFIPVMALIGIAPYVSWKGAGARVLMGRLTMGFSIALAVTGILAMVIAHPEWGLKLDTEGPSGIPFGDIAKAPWMLVLVFFSSFALFSNTWRFIELVRKQGVPLGGFITHAGLAVLIGGLIISRGFERRSDIVYLQEGAPVAALGYVIDYQGQTSADLFDRNNRMRFTLTGPGGTFEARPGLYFTAGQEGDLNQMVWPHIENKILYDVYFTLLPLILDATDLITLSPGESVEMERFKMTYVEPRVTGTPGTGDAVFGALLRFEYEGQVYEVVPNMGFGGEVEPARVGTEHMVTLQRMDAADRSIAVQLHYLKPVMPIELFYKPMTILVWLGTFLLFFGGLWAWGERRMKKPKPSNPAPAELEPDENPETTDSSEVVSGQR
ncbi:MAG: cytochrome c biogenesis protein CcsA [Fimbriimonadaceae bacterium]